MNAFLALYEEISGMCRLITDFFTEVWGKISEIITPVEENEEKNEKHAQSADRKLLIEYQFHSPFIGAAPFWAALGGRKGNKCMIFNTFWHSPECIPATRGQSDRAAWRFHPPLPRFRVHLLMLHNPIAHDGRTAPDTLPVGGTGWPLVKVPDISGGTENRPNG